MASVVFMVVATAFWATIMSIYHILSSDEVQHQSPFTHNSQSKHLRVMPTYYKSAEDVRRDHSAAVRDICHRTHVMSLDLKFHEVYTLPKMLSPGECAYIIEEAERHASKKEWHTKRHSYYATVDLELTEIPTLSYYAMNKVYGSILPLFNERYGLVDGLLGVNEVFIVKYATGAQTHLDAHLDGGEFSFIIPLNSNFTGGGTTFPSLAITANATNIPYAHTSNLPPSATTASTPMLHLEPEVGSLVMFCGQKRHRGDVITEGMRYILVGQLGFQSAYACDTLLNNEKQQQQQQQQQPHATNNKQPAPAINPKPAASAKPVPNKSPTSPKPESTPKHNSYASSKQKPLSLTRPESLGVTNIDDDDDDGAEQEVLNAIVHKIDDVDMEDIQLARNFYNK